MHKSITNEKVKRIRNKGSEFKNNKQKILLFKNWETQLFLVTIKVIPELIKAPGFYPHSCFKQLSYEMIAATIT